MANGMHQVFNHVGPLWSPREKAFFQNDDIKPQRQVGPTCVATTLAVVTGKTAEDFVGKMNTQDPISWSDALKPYGKKLAYCATDVRKLEWFRPELLRLDDLFLLCYYSPTGSDAADVLRTPDETGWVCGSHVLTLHRSRILDTIDGTATDAETHDCWNHHTKRIFRVVPADYGRGL